MIWDDAVIAEALSFDSKVVSRGVSLAYLRIL